MLLWVWEEKILARQDKEEKSQKVLDFAIEDLKLFSSCFLRLDEHLKEGGRRGDVCRGEKVVGCVYIGLLLRDRACLSKIAHDEQ